MNLKIRQFRQPRSLIALVLATVIGSTLILPMKTMAATVPTGFQEYRIVGYEEHIYDMYDRVVNGEAGPGYVLGNAMSSIVSATSSSDNQVFAYDHWEDGDDPGLDDILAGDDPATVTLQASTLIFGDNNAANGDACTYVSSPCVNDILSRGDNLTMISQTGWDTFVGGNAQCATPGTLADCVTIPRNTAEVRFDGGDRIVSSGGPVTMVHVQEPAAHNGADVNAPGNLGGAVEILSKQAVEAATSFSIPVILLVRTCLPPAHPVNPLNMST